MAIYGFDWGHKDSKKVWYGKNGLIDPPKIKDGDIIATENIPYYQAHKLFCDGATIYNCNCDMTMQVRERDGIEKTDENDAKIMCVIVDPFRFEKSTNLASYAGLTPETAQPKRKGKKISYSIRLKSLALQDLAWSCIKCTGVKDGESLEDEGIWRAMYRKKVEELFARDEIEFTLPKPTSLQYEVVNSNQSSEFNRARKRAKRHVAKKMLIKIWREWKNKLREESNV
jgi:hypothetical protein